MKKSIVQLLIFIPLFWSAATADTIQLATGEWPPYTSDAMKNKGFASEIVKHVLNDMGHKTQIGFYPWRRCYQYVLWDKVWGAFPYSITVDRSEEVLFSDEIASSTSKLFFFSATPHKPTYVYNKLTDLRQYKLGAVIGYFYEEMFKKAKLNVDYVAKEKMALEKLMLGRIQLFPLNEMVGWAMIKNQFPNQAKHFGTLEKPLNHSSLHLIINKKNSNAKQLLDQFNTQLKIFMKSPQYQTIIQKYSGS